MWIPWALGSVVPRVTFGMLDFALNSRSDSIIKFFIYVTTCILAVYILYLYVMCYPNLNVTNKSPGNSSLYALVDVKLGVLVLIHLLKIQPVV